jgi:hypothetical protein
MPKQDYETIRLLINDAKANYAQNGVNELQLVLDVLNRLTDAAEQMEQKREKIEANIAKRLGGLLAMGLESDFIRDVILNGEPNYPYGKDDPDQLEFDKMVDDTLRDSLRNRS